MFSTWPAIASPNSPLSVCVTDNVGIANRSHGETWEVGEAQVWARNEKVEGGSLESGGKEGRKEEGKS